MDNSRRYATTAITIDGKHYNRGDIIPDKVNDTHTANNNTRRTSKNAESTLEDAGLSNASFKGKEGKVNEPEDAKLIDSNEGTDTGMVYELTAEDLAANPALAEAGYPEGVALMVPELKEDATAEEKAAHLALYLEKHPTYSKPAAAVKPERTPRTRNATLQPRGTLPKIADEKQ